MPDRYSRYHDIKPEEDAGAGLAPVSPRTVESGLLLTAAAALVPLLIVGTAGLRAVLALRRRK